MTGNPRSQAGENVEKSAGVQKTARIRIETQIHRRSKAKAVFPLEAEWQSDSGRSANLKMLPEMMDKHGHVGRK